MRAHTALLRRLQGDGAFRETSTSEYDVLDSLSRADHPLSQVELTSVVALSQPTLSRLLGRLEERGLIIRNTCAVDARRTEYQLTDNGLDAHRRTGRLHGQAVADAFHSALSEAQIDSLTRLCELLIETNRSETQ